MFFLYFDYLILVVFRFGFEGWICVLIAPVPDMCILFTSVDSCYIFQTIPDFGYVQTSTSSSRMSSSLICFNLAS